MDPRVKPAGDSGKNGKTMATFHFDLVSPEKLAFSGEVDQVDVPGVEGDFGVLAGHAPLVAAIRPGILTIHSGGSREKVIVLGGLAEVFTGSPGKFVDLADTIKGFRGLCEGKYDHLPEAAFYMVGTIEEAVEKGKKLAAEAA